MRELVVDNFAGGGGASTGIEMAIRRSVDIAINHDPDAIAMHKANHPNSKHYCEDVWQVDPVEACAGNLVALAWFSPDCKHFSRAKGGKPVDKNIRGLAWVAIKWALKVRPRVIMLENVPEIQTWGPLGKDNKPIPERAGETFQGFISALSTGLPKTHPAFEEMCNALEITVDSEDARIISEGLGYEVRFQELRSCDYGAPTKRKRFYMIARCDAKPIIWPQPTHSRKDSLEVATGICKPWHAAAECLDWTKPGKSIFDRKKPLCEKTMKRIAHGLKKFVIDNPNPFVVDDKYVPFLIQYHSEQSEKEVRGQDIQEPIMTLDTSNRYALICPYIVTLRNNMVGQSIEEPIGTLTTSGAHHVLVYAFLIKYYGTISACAADEPIDTLTTKDRFALITVHGVQRAIVDIYMRFLEPREMYRMTGFPECYIIDHDADGNPYKRETQVEKCGNCVTPPVATALVRANLPELCG